MKNLSDVWVTLTHCHRKKIDCVHILYGKPVAVQYRRAGDGAQPCPQDSGVFVYMRWYPWPKFVERPDYDPTTPS